LYRYNPEAAANGNNPFQRDSRKIKGDLFKFLAKVGWSCGGFMYYDYYAFLFGLF